MNPSACKQQPSGLYLPLRATLKGRLRWQVLDERGVPEVPRNPSGFAIGPAEGIEQPNLITDLGLDQIAAYNAFDTNPTSSSTWRRYLAVGTGSTAPAAGDTILASEVQRAASSGTFGDGSVTYELDTANNVWRATIVVNRVVTMTADRNLTEFGFSPASSVAIGIRELLRDASDNPITVSLLTDKSLLVEHTLTIEIPAPAAGNAATINIEEYDAANNLVNTIAQDIIHGGFYHSGFAGGVSLPNSPFAIWAPHSAKLGTTSSDGASNPTATVGIVPFASAVAYARSVSNTISNVQSLATETYVSGSYQRIKRATFAAGEANGALYGIATATARVAASRYSGWMLVFDSPATYTKQSTDTLRAGFISSWDRA